MSGLARWRRPSARDRLGRLVVALGALVASAEAWAAEPVVELHPANRCLAVVAGAPALPTYPELARTRGDSGKVVVDLTFSSPDARPRVIVIDRQLGNADFEDAVLEHVRQLRAPCLQAEDGPLRLRREFHFRPDGGPVRMFQDDLPDPAVRELLKCVAHTSGHRAPEYPRNAKRDNVVGRVLVEKRFDGPDQAPQVKVHARPGRVSLEWALRQWSEGLRMPCHPGGSPIHATWTYVFTLDGEHYGFKGLDLVKMLPAVKDIRRQTLQFDTSTMRCPFEVSFQYRQPAMANRVGEVGASVDSRAPMLVWLKGIELIGNAPQLDAMFGDTVRLVVPCVNIDLKPKE